MSAMYLVAYDYGGKTARYVYVNEDGFEKGKVHSSVLEKTSFPDAEVYDNVRGVNSEIIPDDVFTKYQELTFGGGIRKPTMDEVKNNNDVYEKNMHAYIESDKKHYDLKPEEVELMASVVTEAFARLGIYPSGPGRKFRASSCKGL